MLQFNPVAVINQDFIFICAVLSPDGGLQALRSSKNALEQTFEVVQEERNRLHEENRGLQSHSNLLTTSIQVRDAALFPHLRVPKCFFAICPRLAAKTLNQFLLLRNLYISSMIESPSQA